MWYHKLTVYSNSCNLRSCLKVRNHVPRLYTCTKARHWTLHWASSKHLGSLQSAGISFQGK